MPHLTTYAGLGLITATFFYLAYFGEWGNNTLGIVIFAGFLLLIEPLKKWKERKKNNRKL